MRDDDLRGFVIDPFAQQEPFVSDPTATVIDDPIAGVATSNEWRHPDALEPCPVTEPQAARWQEHAFDITDRAAFQSSTCVELARFMVPASTQGLVSKIETSIWQELNGVRLDNRAGDWPSDYQFLNPNAATENYTFRFYLRLQSWTENGLPRTPTIVVNRQELPGFAHPDLGQWSDARYDYARRDNHVSLFVPEGHYLRLFLEFVMRDPSRVRTVWGRLAGVTQTYHRNPEAITNARIYWGR